jgi:hydrogenase expression/formation protein HypD
MKFIDEYRDPELAGKLVSLIEKTAKRIGKSVSIMEICGSHTFAIGRFGIRKLLPESIRLISGPGCPVCVTSAGDVDRALWLASRKDSIFATFGDMLRVPGTGGDSLQRKRASGADIRVISSADESVEIAAAHPDKQIILMGIGFETTSPTIAASVRVAERRGIKNLSVFSVHKTVPPALHALITDQSIKIDGFLCPGHVSTIIGSDAYRMIPAAGMAAVIAGFEPIDILQGIWMILKQIAEERMEISIQYGRGVSPGGNPKAKALLESVFRPETAEWRGIGAIPDSGLAFSEEYAGYDAVLKFEVPEFQSSEQSGCGCGDVLRGLTTPHECPLFRKFCTPLNPVGPCMVSSDGTCATYFKYY